MKRKIVSIVCFLIFIFPSFVLAEVVSDSASTATASLVYNPESYYTSSTNRRDLIGVNPYAGTTPPIQVSLLKDYEDFKEPDFLRTLNVIDYETYQPRSVSPFKMVRLFFSYITGKSDYILPTKKFIIEEKKPAKVNRNITFITKSQAAQSVPIAFSTARSWEGELPYLSAIDAIYPLMIGTESTCMCLGERSIDQGVAEGNANSISMVLSKAAGKSGNDDAEQFSMGATGTSGRTVSRREILHEYLFLAYLECPPKKTEEAEAKTAPPKATYLHAPVFYDFNKYDIRADEAGKIPAIAEAVYQQLSSNSDRKVYFVGNCDQRGPEGLNDTLGMNRGMSTRTAVIAELTKRGIDTAALEKRLFYVSAGKRQRIFDDSNETSHQLNRRVDVVVAEDITSTQVLPLPELIKKG